MIEHRESVNRFCAALQRCGFAPACQRHIAHLYAVALEEQTNDAWCAFYLAVKRHLMGMSARMRAKSPADVEALELLMNDDFGRALFSQSVPAEVQSWRSRSA